MFPYELYKVVHFLGIFMVWTAMGGLALAAANAGDKPGKPARRMAMTFHGLGLFLVLLGGFGMLARMGLASGLPGWIHAKLAIWLLVGVLVSVPLRVPKLAAPTFLAIPLLGTLAAWVAIYKPF